MTTPLADHSPDVDTAIQAVAEALAVPIRPITDDYVRRVWEDGVSKPIYECILGILQSAYAADPDAMEQLMKFRTPCNDAMADSSIIVESWPEGYTVGFLGILNAIMDALQLNRIATRWEGCKPEQYADDPEGCTAKMHLCGFVPFNPDSAEALTRLQENQPPTHSEES